jgi:hypothetical protein
MRKALIAVIVAAALFAVGAFAAQFTVTADDVASGNSAVGSCASEVRIIEYITSTVVTAVPTNADWTATQAKLQLVEKPDHSCAGATVDIAIGRDSTAPYNGPADDWTTNGSCEADTIGGLFYTCTFPAITVRPIVAVSVLVNGNTVAALP